MNKQIERNNICFFLSFAMAVVLCSWDFSVAKGWVVIIGTALFGRLIHLQRSTLFKNQFLGSYANMVTVLRLVMVLLGVAFVEILPKVYLGGWLILAIALDGLDGYLARKFNAESEFGAALDMETDAFYCASLSLVWWNENDIYAFVLLPGFMRYLYAVILQIKGRSAIKESLHPLSKWFAVSYFIALLFPFFFSPDISVYPMVISGFLILYSFAYAYLKNHWKK